MMGVVESGPEELNYQRHHETGALWNRATLVERKRLDAEYADKLLAAHAQGVEQGAAAERARVRWLALKVSEEADEAYNLGRSPEDRAISAVFANFAALLGDR